MHKIQDQWENTIYEIVEHPLKKHTSFQKKVGLWSIQKKPWAHGWQLQ